jgi:hypothetical protein
MVLTALLILASNCVLWDPKSQPVGVGWVAGKGALTAITRQKKFFEYLTSDENAYAEWGWQWAPWAPTFEGTDFTPYRELTVEARMTGMGLPADVTVSLASPGDHHTTERLSLQERDPKFGDGRWHRIRFCLADFKDPKGLYEPKRTIQVIFGTWNGIGGTFGFAVRKLWLSN